MFVEVDYGRQHVHFDVPEEWMLNVNQRPMSDPVDDPSDAVLQALESPHHFPALRRAVTPDDHLVLVVDESLPHLPAILSPILHYLLRAYIEPEAITLLTADSQSNQSWVEELPEEFDDVRLEAHDPTDRDKLAYLATTAKGRRIYLNRSLLDADQVIILTKRDFDSLTGYAGAETAIFPALSDAETQRSLERPLSLKPPGKRPWPIQQEAAEVAWLVGVPFLVQIVEGADSELAHVIGGVMESSVEGQRLLNTRWRVDVEAPVDVVIASMTGDAGRHGFAEVAKALANASRIVKPDGRIVLLTDSDPHLGEAASTIREFGDSRAVLNRAQSDRRMAERQAAFHWASAVDKATVYLLSRLDPDTAEELLVVPMEHAGQAQRLVGENRTCLFLPEAHKTMAVLQNGF